MQQEQAVPFVFMWWIEVANRSLLCSAGSIKE